MYGPFLIYLFLQERFRPLIQYMPSVIHVANTMMTASKIFNIPVVATEQYPRALGKTGWRNVDFGLTEALE
jgi:hypothetical protein